MKQSEAYNLLIKEYLSKCKACDECVASGYCTENHLRTHREPQPYCEENLKMYFRHYSTKYHNLDNIQVEPQESEE